MGREERGAERQGEKIMSEMTLFSNIGMIETRICRYALNPRCLFSSYHILY